MKLTKSKLREIIREEIQKLNERAPKPGMIKKVQAILQKELGGNIEVKKDGDGATFKVSGKNNGLYVDFYKHPAYGDTFEIYVVKKDGFPTGGSAAHADADSEKDALKSVMVIAKKNKKLLQK